MIRLLFSVLEKINLRNFLKIIKSLTFGLKAIDKPDRNSGTRLKRGITNVKQGFMLQNAQNLSFPKMVNCINWLTGTDYSAIGLV